MECLEMRILFTSIPISNPGFENPTLADGAWQATIPNWTLTLASDSTAGPWNPTASHFSPQASEGSNVVYVDTSSSTAGESIISQQLSSSLAANTTYTLQVDVGYPNTTDNKDYRIELTAGGQVLAQDDNSLSLIQGGWKTSTINYTAAGDDPNLGDPLGIRLIAKASSGGYRQIEFDNVRLTSDPAITSPTNLTSILNGDSMSLTWSDNSSGEDGFTLECSINGEPFDAVDTVGAGVTSYTLYSLLPNVNYQFRVAGYIGSSYSGWSVASPFTTLPRVPEGLSATEVSSQQINVSWDPISNLNYLLQRRVNGGSWQSAITLFAGTGSYSDTGLTEGHHYEYRLAAQNSAGTTNYSDSEGRYTIPAAPDGLSGEAKSANSVQLDWTNHSTSTASYVIEVAGPGGAWWQAGTTGAGSSQYTISGLTTGTSYQFRVKTRISSVNIESSYSNTTTVSTPSEWEFVGNLNPQLKPPVSDPEDFDISTNPYRQSPTWLNGGESLPVGYYRVVYLGGAADWHSGPPDYEPNDVYGTSGYYIVFESTPSSSAGLAIPGAEGYDTAQEAEDATATLSPPVFSHAGGKIGIWLSCAYYSDNQAGSTGAPNWKLEQMVPKVRVVATQPQTMEGDTQHGQFTISREGANWSQPLTVHYSVSGSATAGSDYTALSGSVTIAANTSSATVDVAALADSAAESMESVTLTLTSTYEYDVADAPGNTATVNILDKKKLLAVFYGAGPTSFGDVWINEIANTLHDQGMDDVRMGENNEKGMFEELFPKIDVDGNMRISAKEVQAIELRGLGYSLGGLQIINFSRKLAAAGECYHGYKLEVAIPFEVLVTIDPVARYPFVKVANGPVKTNVKEYINYFQRKRGNSVLHKVDPVTEDEIGALTIGDFWSRQFMGSTMDSDTLTTQTRVDTTFANQKIQHGIESMQDQNIAWLFGNDVNHLTIVWWYYEKVIADFN
jgi:hypothetical protein